LANLTPAQKQIIRGVLGDETPDVKPKVFSSATFQQVLDTPPVVSQSLGYNGPIPRVATYSGGSKECSYAQWRYEVSGLIHDGT
jgi:hypothetical protein